MRHNVQYFNTHTKKAFIISIVVSTISLCTICFISKYHTYHNMILLFICIIIAVVEIRFMTILAEEVGAPLSTQHFRHNLLLS